MKLNDLERYCRKQSPQMLKLLKKMVEMESPTSSQAAVDRLGKFVAAEYRRRGAKVDFLPAKNYGNTLRAVVGAKLPGKPILVLGHLDTVYEMGTLRRTPFLVRGGRAYGPGTLDMKAGIVFSLFALDALKALNISLSSPVIILLDGDEEVSSGASYPHIRQAARKCRMAMVLEPAANLKGALKTARKGVGDYHIEVEGRAAHAGINPQDGVNAITELSRQLVQIETWMKEKGRKGLSLNAGIIHGGTRGNVVPEKAEAWVDVRIERAADEAWIERKMRSLRPIKKGAKLRITGGIRRPPMVRTAKIAGLFKKAKLVGAELGMNLTEAATGGGSDGNITAAMGVPTLDGLGAVGEGAHSAGEYVLIRELPRRTALLAALLARL